jgi:hypothetical protein
MHLLLQNIKGKSGIGSNTSALKRSQNVKSNNVDIFRTLQLSAVSSSQGM